MNSNTETRQNIQSPTLSKSKCPIYIPQAFFNKMITGNWTKGAYNSSFYLRSTDCRKSITYIILLYAITSVQQYEFVQKALLCYIKDDEFSALQMCELFGVSV
jgi:hypothetical protein